MLKCFIQGAQGVGKTTLIEEYYKKYNSKKTSITICNEVAREILEKGLVSQSLNTKVEDFYIYYYYYLYKFNTSFDSIVIYDRSIIDAIVYSEIILGDDNWISKLGMEIFALMKDKIDLLIYLPIEFAFAEDGIRNNENNYQKDYDAKLLNVITKLGMQYVTIRGSIEQRVISLNKYITELLAQ